MKPLYVIALSAFSDALDVKTLISDANMRRRMSKIVKMGVAAGCECLNKVQSKPEAIITATGYGCVADSEKFLRQMIANHEQQLTPTPFIQSTFNTIGSHLAIITDCRGYNMTFVNRTQSFADALLDAALAIYDGTQTILLATADELTPTLQTILQRMGIERRGNTVGECAHAFMLSAEPRPGAIELHSFALSGQAEQTPLSSVACPVSAAAEFYDVCCRLTTGQEKEYTCGQVSLKMRRL